LARTELELIGAGIGLELGRARRNEQTPSQVIFLVAGPARPLEAAFEIVGLRYGLHGVGRIFAAEGGIGCVGRAMGEPCALASNETEREQEIANHVM
jgi:hypothetical protein